VCGMDVDPSNASAQTDYKGTTYHFCGPDCKKQFDHEPAKYVGKAAAARK
jgi:Cu+-exporting ATPase